MRVTLPIAGVADVSVLADALEAAARAHRAAGIGAAEALEADRVDGEPIPPGAPELVLATLARAGVLERLAKSARTAYDRAVAQPAAAAVAPVAAAPDPVFMAPAPPPAPATTLDPADEPVDLWAGGIT